MKKTLLFYGTAVTVFLALFVFSAKALPDKTYEHQCLEDMDIVRAIVLDLDGDDHYETMITTWCDWENGKEIDIVSPIIYPPEASKGMPINEVANDPFPFDIRKKRPKKGKGKKGKKGFILEFSDPFDASVIIYDYQKNFDDPAVYYTQYVPYTPRDVAEPMDNNGITISPNPASSEVTMSLDIPLNGNVSIKIFNQNGQEIEALDNNGAEEFNFDISRLPSGVYFVHTIVGTKQYVNSLFVVK